MENLINFEDENEIEKSKEEKKVANIFTPNYPLFIPLQGRMSIDLNNPFDKFEYRATHSSDPFECLEVKNQNKINKDPAKDDKGSRAK